ncbi:MAG: ATP synthase F0 subunit B [Spirochaetaceae bacterium]|jgi:F-type H+-transporting ATPase subunit b|nr:ATP synthase F0 subunit B [Spirochaetaceae bacterium]
MLDFSASFFFSLLNIAVLFIVLRAIFFKPLSKFMENRANKIKDEIDAATRDREEAKKLRLNYEDKMKNADVEAMAITQAAKIEAEKLSAKIIQEGKSQAELFIESARRQIQAERHAAVLAFKAQAATLVVAAAGRLLRREISGDDVRAQAELALRELGGGKD